MVDHLTDGTNVVEFPEGVQVTRLGRIVTLTAKKPIPVPLWWRCRIEIGSLQGTGKVFDVGVDRGNGLESIRLVLDEADSPQTQAADAAPAP
jgi:hypothetical protein